MNEPKIKWDVLFGHVELRAWFEYVDGKLVGMGSKQTFDADGKLIGYNEQPTGVVLTMGSMQ